MNTQHCYIRGRDTPCPIQEYIELLRTLPEPDRGALPVAPPTPTTEDGQPLTLCHGQIVKPYFRNCNPSTAPLSEWHREWQSQFAEHAETAFRKHNYEGMLRDRRTDVDLNERQVLEFQHSPITPKEVRARNHDYAAIGNGKEVIWVVDGNDTIHVSVLGNGRVFLEFAGDLWKYKAFADTRRQDASHADTETAIYIDICEQIYRVFPDDVRGNMVDVEPPATKPDFIDALKANRSAFAVPIVKPMQTTVTATQMGAGNGKTFSIIQLLTNPAYAHYDTFVYLTKQHSAVHVIKTELDSQKADGRLSGIAIQHAMQGKKHVVRFRLEKDPNWRNMIIGTIDSFVYALADTAQKATLGKFEGYVRSIVDEDRALPCGETGQLKYAGGCTLNKKLLLVGDELQDLPTSYAKALLRIMRDQYVDLYVVGDKLQSISTDDNAFVYFSNTSEISYTTINRPDAVNVCRRFTHPELVHFVNSVVNFSKFDLPEVSPRPELTSTIPPQLPTSSEDTCPVVIIEGHSLHQISDKNDLQDAISLEVDTLMKHYAHEVEECNRLPNDFLIVTPLVNRNPLVEAFHQRIREYWEARDTPDDPNDYLLWSFFHKSVVGTSIDLSESDELTRILSIHSAKGDGRKVVFVIGCSEFTLKMFSTTADNLIFESLWHVALTRMKEKLYLRIDGNGDKIHQRIMAYQRRQLQRQQTGEPASVPRIPPVFTVSPAVKMKTLLMGPNREDQFKRLSSDIIQHSEQHDVQLDELQQQQHQSGAPVERKLIDMKHHNIRYASMVICSSLQILRHEIRRCTHTYGEGVFQFFAILSKLSTCVIAQFETHQEYTKALCNKERAAFPFYKYSKRGAGLGENVIYHYQINESMQKIQRYLAKLLANQVPECDDLEFQDYVVMLHMLEVQEENQYTTFPISDLFDIFDDFHKKTATDMNKYKTEHYACISHLEKHWKGIFESYPKMNFMFHQPITFRSEQVSSDITVRNPFSFLGYTDSGEDAVVSFEIKPQFNSLNYSEILYQSVFDMLLLQNADTTNWVKDGKQRYHSRARQRVCVLTPYDDPYYIDLATLANDSLVKAHAVQLRGFLRQQLIDHFKEHNKVVALWYGYWRSMPTVTDRPSAKKLVASILARFGTDSADRKHYHPPKYIVATLRRIENRVKDSKRGDRMNVFLSYDKKDAFEKLLNSEMQEAVNQFFGTNCDDTDTDTDTDSSDDDTN
jgi:hypothetical protein